MTITKSQENGSVTLSLTGSLDTNTAPQLYEELIPLFDGAKQVNLDFAALDYVSSAGLRVLLQGEKTAKSKDAAMTLRGVSEEVMEVFEMTGFSDILTIEP